MTRKRKIEKTVLLRALRAFDLFHTGDEWGETDTGRADGLVSGGYAEVVGHGQNEAGPGTAHESDSGGGPQGDPAEGPTSSEPGPDSGSGGHGQAAGLGTD